MTPAEIAAKMAEHGWTDAGIPTRSRRFTHGGSGRSLLVAEVDGEVLLFREDRGKLFSKLTGDNPDTQL
jgi:hypothetical protein